MIYEIDNVVRQKYHQISITIIQQKIKQSTTYRHQVPTPTLIYISNTDSDVGRGWQIGFLVKCCKVANFHCANRFNLEKDHFD